MTHCKNYPCKLDSGCVCKCLNCSVGGGAAIDLKREFEDLKKMVEEMKKENGTHCPHCGKPYVELQPFVPWSPLSNIPWTQPSIPWTEPYQPGTPIGPYWQYPLTISGGTISDSELLKGVDINTFPHNWINPSDNGNIN